MSETPQAHQDIIDTQAHKAEDSFSIHNETVLQQGLTYADSLGYGLAGLSLIEYPGVLAKVAGAGLIVKGAQDQFDMFKDYNINKGGLRERARSMFVDFGGRLAASKGESLSARMKRSVGESVLSVQDRELRYRFNRMMGGMMLSLGGAELIMNGNSSAERFAGAVAGAVGVVEHLKGMDDTINRYNQPSVQKIIAQAQQSPEAAMSKTTS